MPGIDANFICHRLAIHKEAKPVAQRKRKVGGERRDAVIIETQKLLNAGFIREVRYTTWLANVVLVKKNSGKWRMCVDYTDLNRACPKDSYPLPSIDRLVDGASGHALLSFLDAYSGYNQIMMYPPDEVHTSFITDRANYCYRVMPFGLKNAGATYQRLMDKVFHHQIGRNMEVYVDDMVVKTISATDHASDLAEVFAQIRKHNMRLNPEKCVFGVRGGRFLGFMITSRGIEANPEKCEAIIHMQSPQSVKECEAAFQSFKNFLTTPPILQRPDHNTDLLLYLAVAEGAISAVIVQEHQKAQTPIYFISRVLQDAERRYQMVEKLALALVTAARRLRPYFQSHQVVVKTDYPIKQILRKPELAGRMIAWSIELSEFGIRYESRGPLKAQCLADFVAELTPATTEEPQAWTLHVDGSSNSKGGGAGIILEGPNRITVEQSLKFGFKATNNQAEYEALLAGLRLARDLGARRVSCNSDSKLMISSFDEFSIKHVPREQNTRADLLSKLASTKKPGQHRTIIQETLHSPSLDDKTVNVNDSEELGWMTDIWNYLKDGALPTDKDEARKVRMRSAKFTIIDGELFKRGISIPLLKCLTISQAAYVVKEIHHGVCGMHSGARSMAARVLRAGYYWPTLKSDCQNYIQKCKECQQFGNAHRQPPEALHHMMAAWPFSQWGMDILGPFPPAKGQLKFLLVAIDYFTKWIEACPLAKITTENVRKFTWKNIVCRFRIPHTISTTQETPYRLTYGVDAMIPIEVGQTSHRRQVFNNEQNNHELATYLDLLDELRDEAQIHAEACKLRAARRYNSRVKPGLSGKATWYGGYSEKHERTSQTRSSHPLGAAHSKS
uniref:Retrovirus-related Pol polyprotein from transposon 297 family n=1 Tax=Cajanus cajan TaxID=3821 RepID=A0A151SIP0_CAJCA|nr:Retrovirus-related Pol polyprotein from transposon 297 family [Cajanus cajan]